MTAGIHIDASPAQVWEVLTHPVLMAQWMGEEFNISVSTSWEVHSPIIIRGNHHGVFENKGTVLKFEKEQQLSYSHLSSVSGLADIPENYTTITFTLTGNTTLHISIHHAPDEVIQKHLEFYWRGTLHKIREFIHSRTSV